MSTGKTPAEIPREENRRNRDRYGITAWFYDLLDVTAQTFIKHDTYFLIEGEKNRSPLEDRRCFSI